MSGRKTKRTRRRTRRVTPKQKQAQKQQQTVKITNIIGGKVTSSRRKTKRSTRKRVPTLTSPLNQMSKGGIIPTVIQPVGTVRAPTVPVVQSQFIRQPTQRGNFGERPVAQEGFTVSQEPVSTKRITDVEGALRKRIGQVEGRTARVLQDVLLEQDVLGRRLTELQRQTEPPRFDMVSSSLASGETPSTGRSTPSDVAGSSGEARPFMPDDDEGDVDVEFERAIRQMGSRRATPLAIPSSVDASIMANNPMTMTVTGDSVRVE